MLHIHNNFVHLHMYKFLQNTNKLEKKNTS